MFVHTWLVVVCCLLFVRCLRLFVVLRRCSSFVVLVVVVRCSLLVVVYCVFFVVCSFVGWRSVWVVGCSFFLLVVVVCSLFCVRCRCLFVVVRVLGFCCL